MCQDRVEEVLKMYKISGLDITGKEVFFFL